jgi:hypothetical protein
MVGWPLRGGIGLHEVKTSKERENQKTHVMKSVLCRTAKVKDSSVTAANVDLRFDAKPA